MMLLGLDWAPLSLMLLAGVLLDLALGEVRRFHPLVGFGRLAAAIEARLNPASPQRDASRQPQDTPPLPAPPQPPSASAAPAATATAAAARLLARGALAWASAVLPIVLAAVLLCRASASTSPVLEALPHVLMLYFCLGLRSLRDHILPIAAALAANDLPLARQLTARIVSRDTRSASESDLSKAATESLLENGNDAVFGTLFWFAIAGGPGAVLFRLANTLDAMWGYRNARYNLFGRVAARIDDALNYLPARLTALTYALLAPSPAGKLRALQCWRRQAPAWSSPNAGPVMASGAGALGLALGGAATYDGQLEQRPPLGQGAPASASDIARAWRLVLASAWLWIAAAIAAGAIHA